MAVTAFWYGNSFIGQYSSTTARRINWTVDTIRTSLHSSAYVPNRDTNDFFSTATNELATAGGYTAGGVQLTGMSTSYNSGAHEARLIAGNAQWTSATFTARIAVVYSDTAGAAATDPLVSYVDFGADETVSSGTFTIQWDATGVAKITV